ncbi:MAG: hypothetical protein HY906_04955 [Deltaproteobacteria bacterium]|nr:hypothetical protein [Deltaproteobacteria bacterium]
MLDLDARLVEAVLADWKSAPVTPRLRAGLALVEAVTLRPAEPMDALVVDARAAGLDDAAVEDAANVAFHFNLINRAADAFDFTRPTARQLPRLARLLDRMKFMRSGPRASPSWTKAPDGALRPVEVQAGYARLLEAPCASSPEHRRAAEAFCAHQRGARRDGAVPAELRHYLGKVATAAHKVVDEDVAALRAAGWSDRALFEVTMAGAFGASVVGLETLFGALYAQGT